MNLILKIKHARSFHGIIVIAVKKSRQKSKQGNTRKSQDYMPFHAEV